MNIPIILAVALLLSTSLGQLNRLFIGDAASVVLYANDLLAGGLMVTYLGYALVVRRSWKIPPMALSIGLFLLCGLIGMAFTSHLLSSTQIMVSLSYWIRYLSYFFLFFIAYDAIVYAEPGMWSSHLQTWLKWILLTMVLVAVSGFIQLYVLPDLAILAKYGWDPHVGRLTTAMLDPNYAAAYLGMGVAVALAIYFYSHRLHWQVGALVIASILLVAILLTYSRSGYLMLGIILTVIAIFKSRWLLVVGAVLGILAFIFIPRVQERIIGAIEIDDSASPRIISWQNSFQIASDNQPFGVGYNTYRYTQDRYGILNLDESGNAGAGADSSWLFILATTGIAGFLSFGAAYAMLAWMSLKGVLYSPFSSVKLTSLACLSILGGLFVFSQFNNALFYTWIMEVFWLLAGLVVGLHQLQSTSTGDES